MARRPDPAAVGSAKKIISSLRIQQPSEIDIELIANYYHILVRRRYLHHEDGRLVRTDSRGIIVVSDNAYKSKSWRFIIAHELGHFMRHPQSDNFSVCTSGDLSNYIGSGREAEANDFASELLMPESLFKAKCDRNRPSLKDITELANEFQTSLTATALRFVQFAPEPCAVVHSTNGAIDWLDWSPDFQIGIKKGTRLSNQTYAGDLFNGKTVGDRLQQVDSDAWGNTLRASQIDLFEHSRKTSSSSVLTFLWHRYF